MAANTDLLDVAGVRCRLCYGYAYIFTWFKDGIAIACKDCGTQMYLPQARYSIEKEYAGTCVVARNTFWANLKVH